MECRELRIGKIEGVCSDSVLKSGMRLVPLVKMGIGKGNRVRILDDVYFESIATISALVSTLSLLKFSEVFAIIDNSV